MLKSVAFANAVAIMSAVFFIICVVLSYVLPGLTSVLVQSWFHNLGLAQVKPIQLSFNSFVLGFISFTVVSWVTTYFTIELYNQLAKNK